MIERLSPPAALPPLADTLAPRAGPGPGANPFVEVFQEAVHRVEQYRVDAEQATSRLLRGQDEDLHRVAVATQQAELSLELFLQVKNKVVQAYQEIMRMQL